jgi:hypothetical protein
MKKIIKNNSSKISFFLSLAIQSVISIFLDFKIQSPDYLFFWTSMNYIMFYSAVLGHNLEDEIGKFFFTKLSIDVLAIFILILIFRKYAMLLTFMWFCEVIYIPFLNKLFNSSDDYNWNIFIISISRLISALITISLSVTLVFQSFYAILFTIISIIYIYALQSYKSNFSNSLKYLDYLKLILNNAPRAFLQYTERSLILSNSFVREYGAFGLRVISLSDKLAIFSAWKIKFNDNTFFAPIFGLIISFISIYSNNSFSQIIFLAILKLLFSYLFVRVSFKNKNDFITSLIFLIIATYFTLNPNLALYILFFIFYIIKTYRYESAINK